MTTEIATALKHSVIYGIGGVLVKGVSFFLLPLYTHFLTPRDYGVFEVLELSMSLLGMFLNMGITAALLRHYGAAETEAQRRKVVGSIFLFTLATSATVLLVGAVSAPQVTRLLLGPDASPTYLWLAFIGLLIAYIANVPYTALRAREASGTVVTLDTVTALALCALNVYFVAMLRLSVTGLLLSRVVVNIAVIGVLIRFTSRQVFGGMDWKLLRSAISFGGPLVLSNLTMFTLNFSDRFFLQRFSSLEVVGIYAVGYKFPYMLNLLLIQPFNMMWQTRMYIVDRLPDRERVFARIFSLYSAVLIFAGLCMAVFGPELMGRMVDPRYASGESVIAIVSLAYIFLGVGFYCQLGSFLASRTSVIGIVSALAAVLTLGANFVLVSRFGILGAAWATVLGFLAIAAGSYYASQRVHRLPLPVGRVARALAIAIGVYLFSRVLPVSSLAVAVLWKGVLTAAFPLLLWKTRCLSRDEIATVQSLGGRVFRVLRPAWVRI